MAVAQKFLNTVAVAFVNEVMKQVMVPHGLRIVQTVLRYKIVLLRLIWLHLPRHFNIRVFAVVAPRQCLPP